MYGLWIAAGLAVCTLTLVLQQKDRQWKPALVTMLLSALMGLAGAKIAYILLQLESTIAIDGLATFVYMAADEFSMFGGVAGAVGGIWLSAKLLKKNREDWMRLSIPAVALGVGILRLAEKGLGTIGVGGFVPAESFFARFPFAVTNAYGEHLYAVFYLEALFAIVLAVLLLNWRKGICFRLRTEICLFFLALPQLYCESLRARCMKWGFVRVEQLLCGITLLAMLAYACSRMQRTVRMRYWPMIPAAALIACIGLIEYALDKTDIPVPVCYVLMLAALACFGALEGWAMRKRFTESKA